MKQLIHDLVTSIKYLYPCIAYEESFSEQELLIKSETNLSLIYPIKKKVLGMILAGEDYWGRTLFKDEEERYYCDVDGALYFKGNDIEGEPQHLVNKVIISEATNIDLELSEFKPHLEKVKKFFSEHEQVELLEFSVNLENAENLSESKIICLFKLKIQ